MDDVPPATGEDAKAPASLAVILLVSVLVVATCGLIYELLAGTLASYLLGDSVTQFSTVIGTYLFAMGVGSWLSRHVRRDELGVFVRVEILIAALGGWSAAGLFLLFPIVEDFRIALYALVLAIGVMVGLEIPLLIRILRHRFAFRELVSNVLTYDYVGALIASLLFPLVLVPRLGMIRTGFVFGLANVGVALALLFALRGTRRIGGDLAAALAVVASLIAGLVLADRIQRWSEVAFYNEPVIYARSTPYQRIVLTRRGDDMRLYLNGNLQFSTRDEYRYHEALVWPVLGRVADPQSVLILGGGDGLAAREVLSDARVRHVTLVDLDPEMTRLFRDTPQLVALNRASLSSPRITVVNADAFRWVRQARDRYDAVIVDFPDPTEFSLGKLYTESFYREVARLLAPAGVMTVQSTSPLVAPRSYWTVASTLEAAGLFARGYHAYVPSFGEWGFTLAAHHPPGDAVTLPARMRFLTPASERAMFDFPPDMARRPTPVNRLDNQALVRSFALEWGRYDG
ncbi:polyamine aminopropyltransferase [Novosphingobium sp. NBM11]|uniref:polyamine aminopropyltransferase n=1 Tax=Novosphingobium sp. NBM11 TaxID=2596914 RepID=UPI00086B29DF|nr:polyamine aminopropyltransferase [Novosphingobium sp. NBM11]MBF5093074.1 polyamine aminopropyltransferase [Novosphingobium sp. NBM11]ODU68299.1 MAG: spermidine synthase [Novosphingobium sp. SCN 66-18]